jgi:large subunit ribosomal protein L2
MNKLIKKFPKTPSQRHRCLLKKAIINKTQSCATVFFKNKAGRNSRGIITVRSKGSGLKKKYRIILFDRAFLSGVVEFIEYDPYRSANIARIYSNILNIHCYILAPSGLSRGHFINNQIGKNYKNFKIGNLFILQDLPLGVFIHNIFFPFQQTYKKSFKNVFIFIRTSGLVRSAGCSAQLVSRDIFCRLRLPSGEHRLFPAETNATLGILSNSLHNRVTLGKAGRSRWLNVRPTVRGVAMNSIDHPGKPSVSPWGSSIRGKPTRRKKSISSFSIKKI